MIKTLPHKSVQRLSLYRRVLLNLLSQGKSYIFSYQLAEILHINPVQVRNDLMLMGYTASAKKGYDMQELSDKIRTAIGVENSLRIALIGIGNFGKAIMGYISCKKTNHDVVAAFDINVQKVDKFYAGIQCFHIDRLKLQQILSQLRL